MSLSHYIPPFTQTRGMGRYTVQRAVCGLYVPDSGHDPEPTCPECMRFCEANTDEAHALAAKWEAEDTVKRLAEASGGK